METFLIESCVRGYHAHIPITLGSYYWRRAPVLKYFCAFNICHLSKRRKIFNGENFPIYGSSTPVIICEGMRLREATSGHKVVLVRDNTRNVTAAQMGWSQALDFDLDCSDLIASEKAQFQDLLTQFVDLFACGKGQVGQTQVIKHSILTEAPPVQQQLQSIPGVLKTVVDMEITRMPEQEMVRPSHSP